MSCEIRLQGLRKVYPDGTHALAEVDLVCQRGKTTTLVGPSGSGKSTILKIVAGLLEATSGAVLFEGRDVSGLPPEKRNIGMVFQSYALFPHLSVFENVAYGLRTRGLPGAELIRRTEEVLRALQLDRFRDRLPPSLSGGQQQRVSIARALVYRPSMLLLDEPLANLDAKLRVQMREEIRRIQREFNILSLYVTHDQEEAMAISDRLALFNQGRLVQVGRPRDVYRRPASLFAADFIGQANFFAATLVSRDAGGAKVALADGATLVVTRQVELDEAESTRVPAGADGLLLVRPESIRLGPGGDGIAGTVARAQDLGGCLRYRVAAPAALAEVTVDAWHAQEEHAEGAPVGLAIAGAEAVLYCRRGAR